MQPVLVLAPRGRDAPVIERLLRTSGITAEVCADLAAIVRALPGCCCVVATEESLAGPDLPALLDAVAAQPPWSDLAFLVLATKQPGMRTAARTAVLDGLGNPVLLERPLNAESLVSAARSALRARGGQLAVRDLAAGLEERVRERTAALTESEARSRAIFEGFPEPLFIVAAGPDGRFAFEALNPSAVRSAGLASDEAAGQRLEAIMDPVGAADLQAHLHRCVEDGTGHGFSGPLPFLSPSATFETMLTPLRDKEGHVTRVLAAARDVTERNLLEARLRQAQKLEAVGQLTGGVAHDFNNLLQVVLSGLTLMERIADPGRRAQLAENVRRAAQRGGELTKRLLTVARRQSLRPERIELETWMRDGAGALLRQALRGDIRTELRLPPDLPAVDADPAELELALLNLAVNARDAMPSGGTLTVSAEAVRCYAVADADGLDGAFVRLSLGDTGTGMSEETQARVFEPFFTTKSVGQGTGLGLAQVYGFARQSGGGVRLRSALGQGTTVSLLLPVSRRAAPEKVVEASAPGSSSMRHAAVLVCEDDDDVAALVVDMLAQLGHAPTRVTTAGAALGALADGRTVDLLFTDVLMPGGMDGLALAREVARRRPGLPVLLTTGYTGGGAASVPLGLPLLRKPYRIDDLAQAVERALA
jgi:PAS domain S-box-containing protein